MPVNIRIKTIRRLVILLIVLTLIVAGGVTVRISHQKAKDLQLAANRELGMTAFKSADYPLALDKLRSWKDEHPDDYDAMYAYGVARSKVETGSNRHIAEAKQIFEQLTQARPDDLNASHQ